MQCVPCRKWFDANSLARASLHHQLHASPHRQLHGLASRCKLRHAHHPTPCTSVPSNSMQCGQCIPSPSAAWAPQPACQAPAHVLSAAALWQGRAAAPATRLQRTPSTAAGSMKVRERVAQQSWRPMGDAWPVRHHPCCDGRGECSSTYPLRSQWRGRTAPPARCGRRAALRCTAIV